MPDCHYFTPIAAEDLCTLRKVRNPSDQHLVSQNRTLQLLKLSSEEEGGPRRNGRAVLAAHLSPCSEPHPAPPQGGRPAGGPRVLKDRDIACDIWLPDQGVGLWRRRFSM